MKSLFLSHGIPFLITLLVSPHVVDLHQHVENNVHASDSEKLLISATIERCIVYLRQLRLSMTTRVWERIHTCAIDIRSNDP